MAKFMVKSKEHQLLVKVKLSFKEKLDERQIAIFSCKYTRGLLKAKVVKRDIIEYYGPIGISLYDRLKKEICKYDFLFIMEQIVDIVQKLNTNALIINNLVFDIKNVYINETTREIQFIYLPLISKRRKVDILDFVESIIYSAHPLQEDDTDYISRFVYFIKNLKSFDVEQIERYILEEDKSIVNIIKRHDTKQSDFMTDKQADYYAHYDREDTEVTGLLNEATYKLQDDETTVLLEDDGTTTLLVNNGSVTLHRCLTDEMIAINKTVFRIGKEQDDSDFFVGNNDKISRRHADIITRGQRFFIMDLNSKNQTYVNGKVIPAQQEIEIFNGDMIRLANEEFEFRA